MKQTQDAADHRSSYFLIEMILCLLFFSLCCTVCIRIYTAAWQKRTEARDMNHMQELITAAGETLMAWSGNDGGYLSLLLQEGYPFREEKGGCLSLSMNRNWESCDAKDRYWEMKIVPGSDGTEKTAVLSFIRTDDPAGEACRTLSIKLPFWSAEPAEREAE